MRATRLFIIPICLHSLRRVTQQRRRVTKLATWEHLLLGGMSGAVAAAATCPLDALKTAQQVVVGGAAPSVGPLCALRTTVATNGPGALFVGMVRCIDGVHGRLFLTCTLFTQHRVRG